MTPVVISLRGGLHATIRPAAPTDAAAVVAYFEAVAAESDYLSFGPGQYGKAVAEQAQQIQGFSAPSSGVMLVALVGSELAGVIIIHRLARPRVHHRGELGVSVRRQFWGLGLGRALCEAAIVQAGHIGLSRIELHVRVDNARAIALYEALGFQHEGKLRGAFKVGDAELDDLLMALRLHPEG